MNQNTGMIQTLTKLSAARKPSAGPDGPPRNSVTAIADIVMTFMNSARKKIANRMPVYSVWNPPTSSCSASTRSNGGWFVSAVAAIEEDDERHDRRAASTSSVTNEFQAVHACWLTMPAGRERAGLDAARRGSRARTRPRSESSCADARTEPSSGYFEPDDQPASITP